MGQNRFGIPFWLVCACTTHFRTYFSGWIESDVHPGLTVGFGLLAQSPRGHRTSGGLRGGEEGGAGAAGAA